MWDKMTKMITILAIIALMAFITISYGNLNYNGNQAQATHYICSGSWEDSKCRGCHVDANEDILNSYHVQQVNLKSINKQWNPLFLNLFDQKGVKECDQCHVQGIPPHSKTIATAATEVECTSCHIRDESIYAIHDKDGIVGGNITTDCTTCHYNDMNADNKVRYWTSPSASTCANKCHRVDAAITAVMWGSEDFALYDVHAGAGIDCLQCHVTLNHQIGRDSMVNYSKQDIDNTYPMKQCIDCHAGVTHGMIADAHIEKVGCEACHIPVLPGGMSISSLDYSNGHRKVTYHLKEFQPVLAWFNGTVDGIPHQCDRDDPDAVIKPFNVITITWWDEGNDMDIRNNPYSSTLRGNPILLSYVRAAGANNDINTSTNKLRNFDSNYDRVPDYPNAVLRKVDAYYLVSHNIVGSASALGKSALWCADCHGNTSRIDWTLLGYEKDPAQTDPPTDFTTYKVTVEIIPARPKPVEKVIE
jgi:hypothetical protein